MIAVDTANSPIRFTGSTASNTNIDSASFTAPINSLLVVCIEMNGSAGQFGVLTHTLSNPSGSSLTWTPQVSRLWNDGIDGAATHIYTAPVDVGTARTVRVNSVWTLNTATNIRRSAKVYVVTPVDTVTPVDPVTASNASTSSSNNLTSPSITPSINGLLFGAATDWNAGGGAAYEAPSDGSTQDTAWYSGAISVVDGWKVATAGVPIDMNFNAGGAVGAQQKECRILVREEGPANKAFMGRIARRRQPVQQIESPGAFF